MTRAATETEHEVEEFVWAKPHEVEQRISEGWRPCDGWQNAEHHLRYTIPMWRPAQ